MKYNLRHYLFEILAIFIGITGSFLLEDFRENRIKKKQILYSMEALLESMQADSSNLALNIKQYDSQVDLIFDWMNDDYETIPENTFTYFLAVNSSVPFISEVTGYEIFIETEGKELITSPTLRLKISSYYNSIVSQMEGQSRQENDFLVELMNVNLKSDIEFPPKTLGDPKGLAEIYLQFKKHLNTTPEARNRLRSQLIFMTRNKDIAISTLTFVTGLMAEIRAELEENG